MKKPVPNVLPYYRLLDEKIAIAMMAYYEEGTLPEPFLLAILQREEVDHQANPYTRSAVMIHRWVQQWMPKQAWGTKKRVERWKSQKGIHNVL